MSKTDNDWLDEVLRECVDHAYEVMDAKSFADPYAKAKQTIATKLEQARGCVDCKTLRCENCERLWQT